MTNSIGDVHINEYDYLLPPERIASFPRAERDQSKLLVYQNDRITNEQFCNLAAHLPENSLLVLNDTRVIEARLIFQKASGGAIEIFCLEPFGETVEISLSKTGNAKWLCLIGGASKWKHGLILEKKLLIGDQVVILSAEFHGKQEDAFVIEFTWKPQQFSFAEILHVAGAIPLPPYIKRDVTESDKERYQTVFSKYDGSVAAPTAALHFTERVFNDLEQKNIDTGYVTLHVGAGTFQPVKSETISTHQMHREPFTVTKKFLQKLIAAETVIAVGTTSLRTLESLYWLGIKLILGDNHTDKLEQWEAYQLANDAADIDYRKSIHAFIEAMEKKGLETIHCETSLIIVPGYTIRIPSALITNFHQPRSTLLLLVSAFVGSDWKKIYQHALENNYRFLSYGDSSLLWRK